MYGNHLLVMTWMMYVTIAETRTQAKMSIARSFCSTIKSGPAWRPWMVRAAMSMAVIPSPGIPRAIIGIKAPPREALFAVSLAQIPAGFPSPKVSGSLLMLLA